LTLIGLLAFPASAQNDCLNIAHRGGRAAAPESTLLAFRKAIDAGADVLEMDLHATADGVIVVCHDDTVNRTTNGTGAIRSMTFESLRALDAGYTYSPDRGKTHPHRGQGLTIPTLKEVLTAFPGRTLVLEIKQTRPSIVKPVLAVLEEAGATARVNLACTRSRTLDAIRRLAPNVRTSLSAAEVTTFLLLNGSRFYRPPGQLLQIPAEIITKGLLRRAARHNLKVQAWTVNDEATMRRLLDLGVHGIVTDNPLVLERVLAERAPTPKQLPHGPTQR
jgi:glycerophosphoryl diester phosphodiesterase